MVWLCGLPGTASQQLSIIAALSLLKKTVANLALINESCLPMNNPISGKFIAFIAMMPQ